MKQTIPEGTEPDQTVTNCLRCGYWLRGLPVEGPCPECGESYHKFGGVWRAGKILVMEKKALLPRRCLKCNARVEELTLKRSLSWHHPLLYLLLPVCFLGVGLLIYMLVLYLVSKKAVIFVGLCSRHARKRRVWIAACGLLFAAAVAMLGIAVGVETTNPAAFLTPVGLLVACLVIIYVPLQVVRAKRMDDRRIWLRGVHPTFLAELPEWEGE